MKVLRTALFIVSATIFNSLFCMDSNARLKKEKIGTYVITKHFAQRMQERNIDKSTIELALEHGQIELTKKPGASQIVSVVNQKKIKVIVAPKSKTLITVMGLKNKRTRQVRPRANNNNTSLDQKNLVLTKQSEKEIDTPSTSTIPAPTLSSHKNAEHKRKEIGNTTNNNLITKKENKEKRAELIANKFKQKGKRIVSKNNHLKIVKIYKAESPEDSAFRNRKKITDKIVLSASTPLEENIEKAISKNDLELTQRLLNLEAPYNSKSKTLAHCFMISANLNNISASNLVLSYVKSPKQLEKVLRDENFKTLKRDSQIRSIFVKKLQSLNAHDLIEKLDQ